MLRKLLLFTLALLSLPLALSAQAQDTACPTDTFLDVSMFPGAGAEYAAPTLTVSCDSTTMTVISNNIPHYNFWQITPNALVEQELVFQVPLNPVYSEQTTPIPLLGTMAFAINGMTIYGPNEGAVPVEEAYGDPVHNHLMDYCMGHTAQQYHYHAQLLSCFFSDFPDTQPSPIIGYAMDGFPIYGPYGCIDAACSAVVMFQSSYQQVGDPTTNAWDAFEYVAQSGAQYLDACNGRIEPDGSYGYHVTNTFPYVLGCYHGVVNGTFNGQAINRDTIFSWQDFVANGYQMAAPAGSDISMSNGPAGGNPPTNGGNPPPAGGNPPPGGNPPANGGNPPPAGGNPPANGGGQQANNGITVPQVTPDHAGCGLDGWIVVCDG